MKDTQFLGCVPAEDNKTGENLYVFRFDPDTPKDQYTKIAKVIKDYIPNCLFFSNGIDVLNKDEVKNFLTKYFNVVD